jgi:hypothetical protein
LEVFIGTRGCNWQLARSSWQGAVGKEQLARSSWQEAVGKKQLAVFNPFNNFQQPSTSPPFLLIFKNLLLQKK